jgi:hypothetical protein
VAKFSIDYRTSKFMTSNVGLSGILAYLFAIHAKFAKKRKVRKGLLHLNGFAVSLRVFFLSALRVEIIQWHYNN